MLRSTKAHRKHAVWAIVAASTNGSASWKQLRGGERRLLPSFLRNTLAHALVANFSHCERMLSASKIDNALASFMTSDGTQGEDRNHVMVCVVD